MSFVTKNNHSFDMPHVYIFPPEEEQHKNPPWCYFNANCALSPRHTSQDAISLDVPSDVFPECQSIYRPFSAYYSDVLNEGQVEHAYTSLRSAYTGSHYRSPLDDPDAVEVVKISPSNRKLVGVVDQDLQMKKSKNLKARASKAFQTIKNARKTTKHLPSMKQFSSIRNTTGFSADMQHRHEQHTTAAPFSFLSRRNTRSFSQLLQRGANLQADTIGTGSHTIPPPSSETASSLPYLNGCKSLSSTGSALPSDEDILIATSNSVKKSRRKFSFRELHRFFPSSSPADVAPGMAPTAITSPTSSQTPSTSSLSTFAEFPNLDIPVDERVYDAVFFLDSDLDEANRHTAGQKAIQPSSWPQGSEIHLSSRDVSFEMRLDSLHFDSLSFDPEDFNLPMADEPFAAI